MQKTIFYNMHWIHIFFHEIYISQMNNKVEKILCNTCVPLEGLPCNFFCLMELCMYVLQGVDIKKHKCVLPLYTEDSWKWGNAKNIKLFFYD